MRPHDRFFGFVMQLANRRLVLLLSLFILFAAAAAQGQVSFNGLQTTVVSGVGSPQGMIADNAGNIFVADTGNGRVVEQSAGGGPLTVLASGLSDPCGVALDSSGDVFYSLGGHSPASVMGGTPILFKLPAGGGAQTTVPFDYTASQDGNPFNPCGISSDRNGDLYWADTQNGIVEGVLWTGSGWGSFSMVNNLTNAPQGITVDGAGDVFYSDWGLQQIEERPAGNATTTTFASNLSVPWGLAADQAGDVFATDAGTGQVLEFPVGGGGTSVSIPFTGLSDPVAISVDGRGDLYVADANKNDVTELETNSVNLGGVAVGATALTQSLSFNLAAGTSVRSIGVLTQGAASKDFSIASGSTCAAGTVTSATTCTVNVAFNPTAAGVRQGAVVFYGASAQELLELPIYGTGTAAQVAYEGPAPLVVAPGLGPGGGSPVAVDGAGNLFEVDNGGQGTLEEFPRTQSGYGPETTLANLEGPTELAVDGAGNLFVTLSSVNGSIVEIPKLSVGYGTPVTLVGNLNRPVGITVDQGGNIFFTLYGNATIMEMPRVASGYGAPMTVASNFSNAYGIAVDADDNLYLTTLYNSSYTAGTGTVVEIPWGPAGYGTPVTLLESLDYPYGIWVEPGGSVVFATESDANQDDQSGAISYLPKNNPGAGFGSAVTLASGLSYPNGIQEDSAGDIFFTDSDTGQIMSLARGTAPTVNFNATGVGELSTQTQVVTVRNIGTALLTIDKISFPASFPEASSGANTDCFVNQGLEPGASCPLTISFQPATAGAISQGLAVTDNNLGATNAVQSIMLTGTGISPVSVSLSATSLSFGGEAPGTQSSTQSVTMTNTGTEALTISSIAVTGTNASSFIFTNNCGTSLAAGANCTIQGHFAPTAAGAMTAAVTITDNAPNSPQKITLSGTGAVPAALSSPTPGSTFTGASETFSWPAASGASSYVLWIGSTGVGSHNLKSSGTITATSFTTTGLPTNGEAIYVRLYTDYGSAQVYNDYTYTALNQAVMTSPAPGATLTSASETFNWTAATGATSYVVWIGSTGVGSHNVASSGIITTTSHAFTGLPTNGETLYVRLYTTFGSKQVYFDYTYKAVTLVPAVMSSPAAGSTLGGASETFTWTAATGGTGYVVWVGSTGAGSHNLGSSGTVTANSHTFTGLPTNGETVYVRLYTDFGSTQVYNDYTYTAQ